MTIEHTPDGRPILGGCSVLPPMEPQQSKQNTANASQPKQSRKLTAGRFGDLNAFVDCSMASLSRSELTVWFVLYRDTRNGTARTSQSDIARRGGLTDRQVRRAIKRLADAGLLLVVHRGGLNSGPSRYRVQPLATPPAKLRTSVS